MDEVPWLGRLIASRYRIIARLGEGHMAEVYLARHVLIDRLSAIKVLRADMGKDRALRKLFLREAKAVNRINHPNIVEITDYGETPETAFLVMEYVPGESLARVLTRSSIGWERAARLGLQIALALSRAHEMGIIHRDIKPSNVLVIPRRGGDDMVKLTDFGVAKLLDGAQGSATTTGLLQFQLTPGYVAPEMRLLGTMDARSDIFSLGVLVYEACCGRLPFPAAEPPSLETPLTLPSRVVDGVPPAFDATVARLLALDPDERPRDAFEVVAMFRAALGDPGMLEQPKEDSDPPTERMQPAKRARTAPRLMTMPFERIGPLVEQAHRLVRAGAEAHPGLSPEAELARGDELARMVHRLQALVTEDARRLAALEERGRAVRNELGRRLDEIGLELSRAMGWASQAAERSDEVRKERLSGVHPVNAMDALLWEQATLDREEEVSLERADELKGEVSTISVQLEYANEALDREKSTLEAQLEGHVAALRALAGEAWQVLEALAEAVDVRLSIGE